MHLSQKGSTQKMTELCIPKKSRELRVSKKDLTDICSSEGYVP